MPADDDDGPCGAAQRRAAVNPRAAIQSPCNLKRPLCSGRSAAYAEHMRGIELILSRLDTPSRWWSEDFTAV